jgi:methylmalonyl-CoA/ethylmalonyl-CoA epimerase
MIGRLNHVAIATPDLEKGARIYRESLGAKVSEPHAIPEHGVTVVFVEVANTKVELLQPLGANSPIAKFLRRIRTAACITCASRSRISSRPAMR